MVVLAVKIYKYCVFAACAENQFIYLGLLNLEWIINQAKVNNFARAVVFDVLSLGRETLRGIV